jgi:integrase
VDWKRGLLRVTGSGDQVRYVPLHPALREELRAELIRRQCGSCGTGYRYWRYTTAEGFLFAGRYGHAKADVAGRALSRLLGGDWTARTLRHRFATEAYAVERDLRAVQELLGHFDSGHDCALGAGGGRRETGSSR